MIKEIEKKYQDLGKELYPSVFKALKAKHEEGWKVSINNAYNVLAQDSRYTQRSAMKEAGGYWTIRDMFNNLLIFKQSNQ